MLTLSQRLDLVFNETTGATPEEAKRKAAGRRYCVRMLGDRGEWGVFDEHGKRFLTDIEIMAMTPDDLRMVLH